MYVYMHVGSLTHRPSSQGWAPECPNHFACSLLGLSFLPSSVTTLAMYCAILYTRVFMYMYILHVNCV